MSSHHQSNSRRTPHVGFLLTEVLVAAIVLAAVISVVSGLAVRSGRLRLDTRHYQVALEELTNQLDRLQALEEADRAAALERLTPSEHAQAVLASPKLSAQILDDAHGRRLTLSLAWDRFGKREPVTLVGWLPAVASGPGDEEAPTE